MGRLDRVTVPVRYRNGTRTLEVVLPRWLAREWERDPGALLGMLARTVEASRACGNVPVRLSLRGGGATLHDFPARLVDALEGQVVDDFPEGHPDRFRDVLALAWRRALEAEHLTPGRDAE